MTRYAWKPLTNIQLDAQAAGEELERLRIKNNGQLTPRAVVDAAKDDGNPLRKHFDWNDKSAAGKWRENQASHMIRSIVVEMPEAEAASPVRAFVSVSFDEAKPTYTSTSVAMSDKDMRAQVLARAWKELFSWRERYRELEELARVFALVDKQKAKE